MASSSFVAALLLLLVSVVFYQNAVYCAANGEPKQRSNTKQERSKAHEECDIYQGKWVFDGSYPLYEARKCRFILNQFGCQENGRPDSLYLKFRWQPSACNLPRVNGAKFLSRFRDKQIMFVGDSIGLNQWESLTCMLHISVPHAKYSLTTIQGLSIFKFHGYNVSVMFSRNAFLVDILYDSKNKRRVLKLDSGEAWKATDVLIFNSISYLGEST